MDANEKHRRRLVDVLLRPNVVSDVVRGIIAGGVLAFIAANLIINLQVRSMTTTVNGWRTTRDCGVPGSGFLRRAACAKDLPAVNVPAEAVYWTTVVDSTGGTLTGAHDYALHFPPGGLPPNDAFWSLTMTNAKRRMVTNPIGRYSLGDRSGLTANQDGSIDIYLQTTAPAGHRSNWLPAPASDFMLWLRAYQPGAAVLNGSYRVPAVRETT